VLNTLNIKKIYFFSIFIFITTLGIYFYNYPLNEDSVWIVYSTLKMLNGATLYIDIVEVNPPLIFLLNTIPVYLGELIGMKITIAYVIFTLFLSIVSLYLSNLIFKANKKFSQTQYYLLQIALLFTLVILPSKEFGERASLYDFYFSIYFYDDVSR